MISVHKKGLSSRGLEMRSRYDQTLSFKAHALPTHLKWPEFKIIVTSGSHGGKTPRSKESLPSVRVSPEETRFYNPPKGGCNLEVPRGSLIYPSFRISILIMRDESFRLQQMDERIGATCKALKLAVTSP